MRGVVVFCLIFLIPGQGAAQTTTINVTEATKETTIKPGVATSAAVTLLTNHTNAASANITVTPKTETLITATAKTETTEAGTPNTETTGDTTPETSAVTADPPTTAEPVSCSPGVCGNGTRCFQLYQTYVCQCPLNYHYNTTSRGCRGGQSFFGEFTINVENFDSAPGSQVYTTLYKELMNQSEVSLSGLPGYVGTNIVLMSLTPSKSQTRSGRSPGVITAKVEHLFTPGATSAEDVTKAIKDNAGIPGEYKSKNICDGFYCDAETTQCVATPDEQGATCSCKEGKYPSPAQHVVTTCGVCGPECSPTDGHYCKLESKAGPQCTCLPGYKSNGDKCDTCEFGYSGGECEDNYLLILVIVGAVLGAAVLVLLGAVIGVSISSKKGKKHGDRTTLIEKDEKTPAENSPAPGRLFPKVQAKSDPGEVNKAASVYEGNEEFTRNFPKRDYDENPWYEMARKDRSY
ncbi:mucin-13 [Rhinoderma darwinii]|uniref:mucin-13 n=1 Tax=Rhinoderma darwinii TaxID=43563 RepID=UPI003F66B8E6